MFVEAFGHQEQHATAVFVFVLGKDDPNFNVVFVMSCATCRRRFFRGKKGLDLFRLLSMPKALLHENNHCD